MPDIKNDIGAREVEALERRCLLEISYEYGQAATEMQDKLLYYLQKFAAEDALERQKLEAGQITQKEYGLWRQRKMLLTSSWRNMRDILTQDAVNADMIAASIIKGYMPEAYATGFNYATYLIEKSGHIDTNFILYDKSTIERLWREYPKLMPDPAPNSKTAKLLKVQKDMRWNRGHIQSAVTQSILQGESLTQTANRLQHVVEMDNNVAKRSAATMLTSAQNGGRQDSYARAEALGVNMLKLWIATIDGDVRNAHRDLDGQAVKQDEPFKSILGDIMFPGDPNADPANVYNCRCTMGTQIKGFESDPADTSVRPHDIGDMTYEEWKAAKGNEAPFKAAQNYNADDAQLDAYKKLGVKGLPSSTRDFQNIKYYDTKAYNEIKDQARALRSGKEYIPVSETPSEKVINEPILANIHAEFTPANTISEAEEFARNTFVSGGGFKLIGKDVSYKGIDVEIANAINRRLNDIYSQFDLDKLSSLETFGKANKKIFDKHSGAPMLTTNYGNIGLNNTLLKDGKTLSKYVDEGEKSFRYVLDNIDILNGTQRELAEAYKIAGRQLVGNNVEDMITHEVGHHLSYMSSVNKQLSSISSMDWKKYAQSLSGYSNHSFGEYVAESFNAYYNGEYKKLQPELKTIFDSMRKNK